MKNASYLPYFLLLSLMVFATHLCGQRALITINQNRLASLHKLRYFKSTAEYGANLGYSNAFRLPYKDLKCRYAIQLTSYGIEYYGVSQSPSHSATFSHRSRRLSFSGLILPMSIPLKKWARISLGLQGNMGIWGKCSGHAKGSGLPFEPFDQEYDRCADLTKRFYASVVWMIELFPQHQSGISPIILVNRGITTEFIRTVSGSSLQFQVGISYLLRQST